MKYFILFWPSFSGPLCSQPGSAAGSSFYSSNFLLYLKYSLFIRIQDINVFVSHTCTKTQVDTLKRYLPITVTLPRSIRSTRDPMTISHSSLIVTIMGFLRLQWGHRISLKVVGKIGSMKFGFLVKISTLNHCKSDLNSSLFEFMVTIYF